MVPSLLVRLSGLEIALIVVAVVVAFLFLCFWLSGLFIVLFFLDRRVVDVIVRKVSMKQPDILTFMQYFDREWFEDPKINVPVSVKSYDHKTLHAYLAAKEDCHRYLVHFHGYASFPVEMTKIKRQFFEHDDINILSCEERAADKSKARLITLGIKEGRDVKTWVTYLIQRDPLAEIVLFGDSMGGATVMEAFKHDLPSHVKGVIVEAGYYSVRDMFFSLGRRLLRHGPIKCLVAAAEMNLLCLGIDIRRDRPGEGLKACHVPCLFIHGEKDETVPVREVERCAAVVPAGVPIRKEIFPDTGHVMAMHTDMNRYLAVFRSFFKECLPKKNEEKGT